VTRTCAYCGKTLTVGNSRFIEHAGPNGQCPLSFQKPHPEGLTDPDYRMRMKFVADLAFQVQDADPMVAWHYLTALPADEVQRLLMVALAGIPIDKTVNQIFDDINILPVARQIYGELRGLKVAS